VVPGDIGGVLLLLALIPGWLYLRLQERLRPPSGTTGLGELLEVVAVGLATTGVSAVALALWPYRFAPILLDVDAWSAGGDAYLRDHVRPALGSLVAVLLLAVGIAYGLYWLQQRRLPTEFRPQGNVWVHALGARPKGTVPWVGLQLDDGRLVEGVLHSYTLDGSTDERDVALSRPIRVTTQPGDAPQALGHLDRLIVPDRSIVHISVVHAPER
jgi:hypothetical protein